MYFSRKNANLLMAMLYRTGDLRISRLIDCVYVICPHGGAVHIFLSVRKVAHCTVVVFYKIRGAKTINYIKVVI